MGEQNLELDKLKKLAIEKLLSNEYGKYDYVEKLLGRDFILGNPPRLVRSHLSELLEIPIEKLKYDTFIAWLRSYKKRQTKLKNDPSSLNNQNLAENNISDPFNFIPTDPLTLIKKKSDISSLIKIANRP